MLSPLEDDPIPFPQRKRGIGSAAGCVDLMPRTNTSAARGPGRVGVMVPHQGEIRIAGCFQQPPIALRATPTGVHILNAEARGGRRVRDLSCIVYNAVQSPRRNLVSCKLSVCAPQPMGRLFGRGARVLPTLHWSQ